ncbi:unnamed protein product [Leptosia nina]|uniref:Uncharacterized protein n=1 Tax=Leptosia nina TaxID=320188 RepID=A0AAV1IZF5_9NEOP
MYFGLIYNLTYSSLSRSPPQVKYDKIGASSNRSRRGRLFLIGHVSVRSSIELVTAISFVPSAQRVVCLLPLRFLCRALALEIPNFLTSSTAFYSAGR